MPANDRAAHMAAPPITETFSSDCATCARKHLGKATCDAFPAGIPAPLLDGTATHRAPFPGDNGLIYAPVKP